MFSESLSPNKKKRLHFLADLWSQSEFRTRRKTNPKSEMTQESENTVSRLFQEETVSQDSSLACRLKTVSRGDSVSRLISGMPSVHDCWLDVRKDIQLVEKCQCKGHFRCFLGDYLWPNTGWSLKIVHRSYSFRFLLLFTFALTIWFILNFLFQWSWLWSKISSHDLWVLSFCWSILNSFMMKF